MSTSELAPPRNARGHGAAHGSLESLSLLQGLVPEVRAIAEDAFTTEHYGFGEVIFRQGENVDAMGVIVEGSVRVLTVNESGDEVMLNVRGPAPDLLGLAMLDGGAWPVTLRARTPTTMLRIDRGLCAALARRHPEFRAEVERNQEVRAIHHFLALETVLGRLPGPVRFAVAERCRRLPTTTGSCVVSEGDPPGSLYVVREGRLQTSAGADGRGEHGFLRAGDLFGDRALFLERSQEATVTAVSDGVLIELPGDAYRELSLEHPELAELLDLRTAAGYQPSPVNVPLDFARELERDAETEESRPESAVTHVEPTPRPGSRGRREMRGFPVVRQLDVADCGAACLAMVCRRFGRRPSMFRVRSAAATTVDGTSLLGLQRGAAALGLSARAIKLSASRLSELALPAIAHWEGNHWVVLYRVDADQVRIADPARGLRRIPRQEAERSLTGFALTVQPSPSFFEQPDDRTSARWLLQFLRPERRTLVSATLLAFVAAAVEMLIPVVAQQVIDHALPHHDRGRVNLLGLALLGILVIGAVAMVCQRVLLAAAAVRIDGSLLSFLTSRLLELPMSYFNMRRIGDIERRLNSVVLVRQFVVQHGVVAIGAAAQVLAAVVVMLIYSPLLTLVFLAVTPLYAALLWVSRRWLKPAYDAAEEAYGKYQSRQIDAIKGIEAVKALAGERELRESIIRQFTGMRARVYRADLASMLFEAAILTLGFLTLALFVWIGSLLVLDHRLSFGALVAFNALVLLASAPLATLMMSWDEAQYAGVLIGRMNDITEPEPEQGNDHSQLAPVPSLSGQVSLRKLTYAFPGTEDRPVLRDISLEVAPGTKVAIVGRSGSGKTTLVKLLIGLLEPTAGHVRYDSIDMQTLDWRQLRRHVGFVLQDNYMFDDTIARNIAFGEPEPDLNRVITAARSAAAHEFIERLPFGYETKVGDSGLMLSGGQRQRIAIARAIYNRPPIIIMDEATSALDTESELAVKQELDELLHGRTSFTIAHRLSTIRDADIILVLEGGTIAEHGTHTELIARRGLYHHLASRQLEL
jgi:ATP-binding cassette subfamily B protein